MRKLKSDKAAKADIDSAVAELLALKASDTVPSVRFCSWVNNPAHLWVRRAWGGGRVWQQALAALTGQELAGPGPRKEKAAGTKKAEKPAAATSVAAAEGEGAKSKAKPAGSPLVLGTRERPACLGLVHDLQWAKRGLGLRWASMWTSPPGIRRSSPSRR